MDPEAVDELCDRDSSRAAASTAERGSAGRDRERAAAPGAGRLPHGGTGDPWTLDFRTIANTEVPSGVAHVYEAGLSELKSYPADGYVEYRAAVADWLDCEARDVVPTAGGVHAFRLTVATTLTEGDTAVLPAPSFQEYAREVRLQGAEPRFVPQADVVDVDPEEADLVVAAQPNVPVGTAYDPADLHGLAARCRDRGATLLVDETLRAFTDYESLAVTDGVVVTSSLTEQYGLPGMRVGFAAARGRHRDRLDAARNAWTLSSVAASVATHCLRAEGFLADSRERVRRERERMRERLALRYEVLPSEAPYLLLDLGSSEAVDEFIRTLREHDMSVRDARCFRGLDRHVRVTVRTREDNDRLLGAIGV